MPSFASTAATTRPFLRAPLFLVTGASGAGKSRAYRDLSLALREATVLDQDITLSEQMWEQHRRIWLRPAMNLNQSGRPTVLIGTQLPEHYESLTERSWLSEIHYLALVCAPDELGARLRERPAWRGFEVDRIAEHITFNDWLLDGLSETIPVGRRQKIASRGRPGRLRPELADE
jgi:hypothetical protein